MQTAIFVQGKNQVAVEFANDLNQWLKNKTVLPYLASVTAASDGRLTFVFTWVAMVEIEIKKAV